MTRHKQLYNRHTDIIHTSFVKALRDYKKNEKITNKVLAKRLGLSYSTLIRLFNGYTHIYGSSIKKIQDKIELTVEIKIGSFNKIDEQINKLIKGVNNK